jgi:hypothetical protein
MQKAVERLGQRAAVRHELLPGKWITEEFGLFASLPTLTSISRQSIFVGGPPFCFGQSLEAAIRTDLAITERLAHFDPGMPAGGENLSVP